MPARPRSLPPLGERSESPFLSRRSATPDRTWVPSASGRASPAMMQEYGHQIKSDLAPLIQALLTEQPDDTGQFCARYFAKSSGEQSGGDAAAEPAAASAPAAAEPPAAAAPAPRATPIGAVPDAQLAKKYDVIVLGAGPAGVAAAVQAAFFGRRALLIDDPGETQPNMLDLGFGAPTGLYSKALRDSAKSIDVSARRASGRSEAAIWAEVGVNIQRLATNNAETQYQLLEDMRVSSHTLVPSHPHTSSDPSF